MKCTSPDCAIINDLLQIVAIYMVDVMFLIGPGVYRVGDCTKWDNATRRSTREKHGGGIRPICITGDSRKSFIQTQGKNWAQVGGTGLVGRALLFISLVKVVVTEQNANNQIDFACCVSFVLGRDDYRIGINSGKFPFKYRMSGNFSRYFGIICRVLRSLKLDIANNLFQIVSRVFLI
jgi:hypothetical protein